MSFDSSGTFSRTVGVVPGTPIWQGDAASGIKIKADRHDSHDQDLANGLTECLTRTGKGVPAVDIPWGGKKIINLANPDNPQDAATKDYADNPGAATKSRELAGSDLNGRLRFSGATGATGIEWTNADMSLLGRLHEALKTSKRLVINDKVDGTGNDVVIIDETGRINSLGQFTTNLSWDGAGWRTINPGYGGLMALTAGGFQVSANAVATVTDPYLVPTMHSFFTVNGSGGHAVLTLDKTAKDVGAAGDHYSAIEARVNGVARWQVQLAGIATESGGNAGSNFVLTSFDDAGGGLATPLTITRPGVITFGGTSATFGSPLTATGGLTTSSILGAPYLIFATNNDTIYLRPHGTGSLVNQATYAPVGDFTIDRYMSAFGYLERNANTTPPGYGTEYWNFNYGTGLHAYINTADLGAITFSCDYRMKKDIHPLAGVWDKVKKLRPVSFKWRDWVINEGGGPGVETRLSTDSDDIEWGFVAHELQEDLVPTAASGGKDQADVVQSPNLPAIIAALTAALQEAMARIEALEAGHIAVDPFAEQAS